MREVIFPAWLVPAQRPCPCLLKRLSMNATLLSATQSTKVNKTLKLRNQDNQKKQDESLPDEQELFGWDYGCIQGLSNLKTLKACKIQIIDEQKQF